jgi:glycosyltransferase involved in cell wall biosynthesis
MRLFFHQQKSAENKLFWQPSLIHGFTEQDLLRFNLATTNIEYLKFKEGVFHAEWLWIIPPFGTYSGGHADIFMLAASIKEKFNVRVIIAISEQINDFDLDQLKKSLRDNYEVSELELVKFTSIMHLTFGNVVATGWQTVALSLGINAKSRYYFVQDYEPMFFASGAIQEIVKSLYLKNFTYFVIGPWLSRYLSDFHDVDSFTIPFGFDPNYYFSHDGSGDKANKRDKIVIYARLSSARRAAEVAIEALKIAAKDFDPEDEIVFIGDQIELKLKIKNRSYAFLSKSDLGSLYRKAKLVIVFSTTNTSLIPIEALACGAHVLTNDNSINRLNLEGMPIHYANLDPYSVATKIIQVTNSPHVVFGEEVAFKLEKLKWFYAVDDFLKWIPNV